MIEKEIEENPNKQKTTHVHKLKDSMLRFLKNILP